MTDEGFVDPEILSKIKVGRDYVAAKFGFRNHWYPVRLADELPEGETLQAQVCGEKILLKRIDGTVFAIRDQCLHRGVPFSRKIECYTKDTITCWYHGFTYRFDDGLLCGVVGAPDSNVIGRRRLKTYPTQEAKGVVFVFVGDEQVAPPPLREDVPPGFLDDGVAVRGRSQVVNANWRLGCENGFDSTHIFIHKDSVLIEDADLALPLGLTPRGAGAFETSEEDGGPKGVFDIFSPETIVPVFEGKIEGVTVRMGTPQGANMLPQAISMWLPCALKVDPWPAAHLTQFEWYVPIDGDRHIYFQFLAAAVAGEDEEAAFDREFRERWVEKALIGFNEDDIWAREATQAFYADDTGWLREQLFEADGNIVRWRDLASRRHRGLQTPEHVR
ncbi:MAG TPA: Rieske 2Fe-2S domain-containing protein [Phenylobacterium sp.]|nr:Rieske 2Fe-2S domain-containing protein [Phenylobacterium sp.]